MSDVPFCVKKGKQKACFLIDLCVMAIEIKIEYFYYSTKRITPVYIVEEELMTLEYSKYVERIVNEVPYFRRMNSMRLTVKEYEIVDEVDLSRKYFSLQMKGLLDKEANSDRSCLRSTCLIVYQTIGGIVSKETVCCVGGKVKH